MASVSPADALGAHASQVAPLITDTAIKVFRRFAAAHEVSQSRYGMGFGTLWRDLLEDIAEAFTARGYETHRLTPGGYRVPVVNGCQIYVWRVPAGTDDTSTFASSPTRESAFHSAPLHPVLFDMALTGAAGSTHESGDLDELVANLQGSSTTMPLVLVVVHAAPRTLQRITWAVAEFDEVSRAVALYGESPIWLPEWSESADDTHIESFDSGAPIEPAIALRAQSSSDPDA
jgi:hypothetical protein